MGIFKRIGSLLKSNANDMVSRAEDPEKMLNQAIVEMGQQLSDAKKQVAEAIADEKRLRRQWEVELEKSKAWKDKAAMAVRAGDDGLAKEALSRKKEHETLAGEYQKQWEAQKTAVEQIKGSLRTLNDKVEAAKRKRNLLIAKKKRADAQRAVQETITTMGEESAFDTFERMERRIEQVEAEAESAAELAGEQTGDTLSQKFEQLEAAAEDDMELLALKEELGLLEGSTEAEEAPRLEAAKGEPAPAEAEASAEAPAPAEESAEAAEEEELDASEDELAEIEAAERARKG